MRVQRSFKAALTGRVARLVAAAGIGVVLSGALVATGAQAAPGDEVRVQKILTMRIFNSSEKADAQHKVIPVYRHKLGDKTDVAYCVDWSDSVDDGNKYHEAGTGENVTPPHAETVSSILANGFGANTAAEVLAAAGVTDLGGVPAEELDNVAFTGTQAAVWHAAFPDDFTLGVPASVDDPQVKGIPAAQAWLAKVKLVNAIYKYLLGKLGTASLAISPATGTGTVGSKVGPFTVNSHGIKSADLKVSTGGALVDKDGKPVTSLKDGGQFWVDCKAAGTVTITATGKTKVVTVKLWTGNYSPTKKLQTLASVVVTEKELTANATATCNAVPATPSLPVTGAPVLGTIAAGVVLMLVGGGLFLARRRRTRFTA
jgi:LPXTG-motif cell wall-anchored protein